MGAITKPCVFCNSGGVSGPESTQCGYCGGDGFEVVGNCADIDTILTKLDEIKTKINQMQADVNYIKAKV